MNVDELIRMFVLNEIMDDYEELEHIAENVTKLGAMAQKEQRIAALVSLTEEGYAKAYWMASKPGTRAKKIEGVPSLDEIQNPDPYSRCYFWATLKGNDEHGRLRSLDPWPFDEDGELKK